MEQRKTQPSWIATADKQESGWTGGAAWPPVIAHDDPADKEIVVLMNWQGHCGNGGLAVRLCLCFFLQCGMSLSLCFVSGGSRRRCYLCHRYICGGAVPLLRFVLLPTRISSCTLGHCFRVGGNTLHSWRLSSSTRVLLTVTSLCAVSTDKGALLRASISVVSIILAGCRSVPGFDNHPFFGLPDILSVDILGDNRTGNWDMCDCIVVVVVGGPSLVLLPWVLPSV